MSEPKLPASGLAADEIRPLAQVDEPRFVETHSDLWQTTSYTEDPNYPRLVTTLRELRGLIVHWRQDRAHQLPPTGQSLDRAEKIILDALGAPASPDLRGEGV